MSKPTTDHEYYCAATQAFFDEIDSDGPDVIATHDPGPGDQLLRRQVPILNPTGNPAAPTIVPSSSASDGPPMTTNSLISTAPAPPTNLMSSPAP